MVPKLLGKTTRETRPDLVEGARRMMRKMSPEDVAMVQRGMAERPDSVPTLQAINVPTLLLTGDEDILTGLAEAEAMRQNISGSQLKIISKAGTIRPGNGRRKWVPCCGNSWTSARSVNHRGPENSELIAGLLQSFGHD